jgi:hypothetical protein
MNVDKRKRFKSLEKKRFENLNEDFDNDFENDFKNASFMNTKFVNLHIIFSFSI